MFEALWDERVRAAMKQFSAGAFLTAAHDGVVNTMTISWGTLGILWGKPIWQVVVRPQRFTLGLIDGSGEFTISIPETDMAEALAWCGSHSGRDGDKLADCGLTAQPGRVVSTPVIAGGGVHFECRVVHRQQFDASVMSETLNRTIYPGNDHHIQFFGEIVAWYSD